VWNVEINAAMRSSGDHSSFEVWKSGDRLYSGHEVLR
jgi:hypothetical protein